MKSFTHTDQQAGKELTTMAGKREAVKKELSARVFNAALQEFSEKGYQATRTSDISKRSDVSVGAIFNYFESKEGLVKAILKTNTLENIFEGLESDEPEDVFNRYIDFIRSLQENKEHVFRFYYNIFKDPQITGLEGFVSIYLWDEFKGSRMEKAILRAQEEGSLPQGEPLKIYRLLVQMTFEMLKQYKSIGLPTPENSLILSTIRFKPKKS